LGKIQQVEEAWGFCPQRLLLFTSGAILDNCPNVVHPALPCLIVGG
jgi:hypothetical protein